MFEINRRKFLIFLATGSAAAIVGSVIIFRSPDSSDRLLDSLLLPEDIPPGGLNKATLNTLIAMAEALAGRQNLQGDYSNYFNWRSQNFAGYRSRYERFSKILQHKSLKMTKRNFGDNPLKLRLTVINSFRPFLKKVQKKKQPNLSDDPLFQFEKFIIQETLHLFARTDAFLALGYDSFPGQARGFETYRKLPVKAFELLRK